MHTQEKTYVTGRTPFVGINLGVGFIAYNPARLAGHIYLQLHLVWLT
jgi:hypothetical protein